MWLLFLIFMFLVPFNFELYQQLLNDLLVLGGILRESPGGREKEIILV